MKVNIERELLLRVLTHVQSVVERRNTIPILANVKIDAADGHLSLNATDMDLDIVERIDAAVATPGSTTAPALILFDIARKLPEGAEVEMDCSGDYGQLVLSAGRSRFKLSCLPPEDFPVMSLGDLPHSFTLSAEDMRSLIDRTRFAISTEETRYYLNGIYFHAVEGDGASLLRAVATDGHRLASVEYPLPAGAQSMPGVIIPRKAINELRKLIDEMEDDLTIDMSDSKIRFTFGGACLTSKLIDGTFPDYSRVIPEGNDRVLEFECRQFAAAVDRVSAISTEKSRAVKLSLAKGNIMLSVNSLENDSATEELAVTYDAPEMEIGFNSRYLLEIANQIGGDTARFTLADAASPTLIRDPGDESTLYVLMPMRV